LGNMLVDPLIEDHSTSMKTRSERYHKKSLRTSRDPLR
jgi:hypothetical protein